MSDNLISLPVHSAAPAAPSSIGELIQKANKLSPEQMDAVLRYQSEHGVRFGDAAVALGFVKRDDVLWALAQQFDYPYNSTAAGATTHSELVVANNPFGEEAEAFRNFRSQLMGTVFSPTPPSRALAIVSPLPGDGKSFFCANLAVAFSQLGGRTLLIDADMRTPRQHKIFDIDPTGNLLGLSNVLAGRTEANVVRPMADLPGLYVLPVNAPPPNPLELVQRPAFPLLMREFLQKFDYVIVDTPAASHGSDARVIAAVCGAAAIVGRRHHTSLSTLKRLTDGLKKSNTIIAGVVMNEH